MLINSVVNKVGNFKCEYPVEVVKNEPMFFNASIEFAHEHGGVITKSFIESLPEEYQNGVIDTRVHMLMPTWYPCIPGFHHDDVPRNTPNGQPNYTNPTYKSRHILGLVNADICPTTFALGTSEFPVLSENVYKQYDERVIELIKSGELITLEAESGVLYEFDWQTWHTGVEAVKNGWRWFGRVSIDTERLDSITNEFRRQVQVYMSPLNKGW